MGALARGLAPTCYTTTRGTTDNRGGRSLASACLLLAFSMSRSRRLFPACRWSSNPRWLDLPIRIGWHADRRPDQQRASSCAGRTAFDRVRVPVPSMGL